MIDIHSHILPGVDDGPEELEESVAMLHMAAESGTSDIVATPHANFRFTFSPDLIERKIAELQKASGDILRIHRGCDFHLHYDNLQDAFEHPAKYAINNQKYVLVELSEFMIHDSTTDLFQQMQEAGMIPIITHPERNRLLYQRLDQLRRWVEGGSLVQITAQSLLGGFGRAAKKISAQLLERRLVHFVASDAHDTRRRPPLLTEACQHVKKAYGGQRAEALFIINPKATLSGEPIQIEDPLPVPDKPYRFW